MSDICHDTNISVNSRHALFTPLVPVMSAFPAAGCPKVQENTDFELIHWPELYDTHTNPNSGLQRDGVAVHIPLRLSLTAYTPIEQNRYGDCLRRTVR